MIKKSLILIVLLAFILTACNGAETPTETLTETPTAPAQIVNPSDCTESATFVTDVTIPDNTQVKQGESFKKTWRIKNTGTCTWTDEYSLVYLKGEKMDAPSSTPLAQTKPNSTLDITINLTAPTKDAVYRTDFEIHDPAGNTIPIDADTIMWVIVTVGEATASGSDEANSSDGPGMAAANCNYSINPTKVNDVVAAINSYRAKNGIAAYEVNEQLAIAAQAHSADMACNNFFIHTGSNGSSPASRAADAGYSVTSIAENVYGSYPPLSGDGVVSWWATDQSDLNHNANLISTKYSEIGVGYSFSNNFGYFVVVFGVSK